MTGMYYEEFEVGETVEHDRRRTVSEADNQRFCDLTMNQQPLHLDAEFAAETGFGERLVNGLLTMSLAVSMTIPRRPTAPSSPTSATTTSNTPNPSSTETPFGHRQPSLTNARRATANAASWRCTSRF